MMMFNLICYKGIGGVDSDSETRTNEIQRAV